MSPSSPASSLDISPENDSESSNRPRKRRRKTRQLFQFRVYKDENFTADSPEFFAQNEPTPAPIG
jgi:hypothetical protein